MELVSVNTKSQRLVVAPLGDLQWSGRSGPTAVNHVRRHIDRVLSENDNVWFIGTGDYIDFLSPSNRERLEGSRLYDTAKMTIADKAKSLVEDVYETMLKDTKGRWLGLIEGHHYYQTDGETSDQWLAEMLGAPFLGTSAYVQLQPSGVVLLVHHGLGGGGLPAGPLNKLYHWSHGMAGADVYMIGHTTRMSVARLSRPRPNWGKRDLTHDDIFLVNCGGFSKSNIVRHKVGGIPRGDYAEKGMMTPSPLAAPIIYIDGKARDRVRVEV